MCARSQRLATHLTPISISRSRSATATALEMARSSRKNCPDIRWVTESSATRRSSWPGQTISRRESDMTRIAGIDLGTTFSLVATVEDGQPRVVSDEQDQRLLPSVVGFSPGGELLVGTAARNQLVLGPERTVKSIKRKMGTDERISLAGQMYTPQEISAFILSRLKQIAQKQSRELIEQAVITVPAYFADAARQATRDAGEIAGLEVVRIINEPTAAALAYGLDRQEEQTVVVYDLGGGTFDVSIVEMSQGVIEVRASHGNTSLGGDDFDALIVDHVAAQFQAEHGIDLRQDR